MEVTFEGVVKGKIIVRHDPPVKPEPKEPKFYYDCEAGQWRKVRRR